MTLLFNNKKLHQNPNQKTNNLSTYKKKSICKNVAKLTRNALITMFCIHSKPINQK